MEKVNSLFRFMLLIQIVNKVKIQPRWVSTKLMPADYLTRAETLQLGFVDPLDPPGSDGVAVAHEAEYDGTIVWQGSREHLG